MDQTLSSPNAKDAPPSAATAWTIFLAGFMSAAVALGAAWRLGAQPLAQSTSRLSLAVWLGALMLPGLIMAFAAIFSWRTPNSPRLVMLVFAMVYGAVVFEDTLQLSDDLYHGTSRSQAMVLGVYDCDDPSAGLELTCVELAWKPRFGEDARRDRYILADRQMPSAPLIRGQCVRAAFWERLDHLVAIDVEANPKDCRELLTRLRGKQGS